MIFFANIAMFSWTVMIPLQVLLVLTGIYVFPLVKLIIAVYVYCRLDAGDIPGLLDDDQSAWNDY